MSVLFSYHERCSLCHTSGFCSHQGIFVNDAYCEKHHPNGKVKGAGCASCFQEVWDKFEAPVGDNYSI